MQEKEYLEDYEVGEVLVTPGRTITEADIVNFAGLTGDWHPLQSSSDGMHCVDISVHTPCRAD